MRGHELAWGAAVAGLAALAGADDGPGTVTVRLQWEGERLAGAKSHEIAVQEAVPEGLASPEPATALRFGRILGRTWIAVDYAADKPRLWVDLDLDGALDDEVPLPIHPPGTAWAHERAVVWPMPDGSHFPLDLRLYRSAKCDAGHVHVVPQAHRAGVVELAGRTRKVALADGNADLRFDDPKADLLLIDLDGDGALAAQAGSRDHVVPGVAIAIGSETWTARLTDPEGTAVELTRAAKGAAAAPASRRVVPGQALPPRGAHAEPPPEGLAALVERFDRSKEAPAADREAVVALIGRVATPEAFAWCERLARGDDPVALRRAAILATGYVEHRPGASRWLALVERAAPALVVSAVCEALHGMDAPEREACYLRLLKEASEAAVVGAAARFLSAVPGDAARAALVETARARQPIALRYQAYLGLRLHPEGPPLDLVRAAATADLLALRAAALRDLGQLAPAEAKALARPAATPDAVLALALALAEVLGANADAEDVAALLRLAAGPEARARDRCRELLLPVRGDGAVKALVQALGDPAAPVRALAATVLAGIPGRDTTDALLRRVKGEGDPEAAVAMLEALGAHGDPRVVETLLRHARSEDADRRAAAIRALGTLGPGIPRVAAFLVSLLDAKVWLDRCFALDAAAANPDPTLAPKVIASLSHEAWQVRRAAAQALARFRVKGAIEPLIVRLEEDASAPVRAATAEALFRITGQPFDDLAKLWRRWWAEQGAAFEVPATIPERKREMAGGTVASFYGLPLESDRMVFVIDESGSMAATDTGPEKRTRLEVALAEVLGAMGRLKPADRMNVVMFETATHPFGDRLRPLVPEVRADLREFLEKRKPLGGTNLWDGLELALRTEGADTVYLLSDGAPGAGRFTSPADILREAGKLNQTRRITIHCVSIGMDSVLLRDLAAANGGRYVRR